MLRPVHRRVAPLPVQSQRLLVCWFTSLFMLPASAPLFAATFCVHDAGEFAAATFTAQGNAQSNAIQMVSGTYALSANLNFTNNGGDIEFTGGWDSGCTQRSGDALATVIDGGNSKLVFLATPGTLTLDGIHFDGIPIEEFSGSAMVARHNVFTGAQGTDAVDFSSALGSVVLDSNVFDHKNVQLTDDDGTSSGQPLSWHVTNNTILNATVGSMVDGYYHSGYGLILHFAGSGSNAQILLANNAVWNNATGGVRVNGSPQILAIDNNWQNFYNVDNVALANGSTGNSTANPLLDANYRPVVPTSPAINSGSASLPGGIGGTDVGGGPRVVGTAPDRGAYESNVDDRAVLVVTTNVDSGTGSLRAALTAAASSPAAQRIEFNLPSCPRIINVSSALPAIVDTLTIDGFTQPGAAANTLAQGSNAKYCVILRGNYAASFGLLANAVDSHVTVRGLGFSNFSTAAVYFSDGSGHVFEGNQFGGSLSVTGGSLTLEPNARGIWLDYVSANSYVGGPSPQQRNVFDASSVFGLGLSGGLGGHEVRNNYIGLGANGHSQSGNQIGVFVNSNGNVLDSNYISANVNEGVQLSGNPLSQGYPQGNSLTGNRIGTAPVAGLDAVQNYGAGVRLVGSAKGDLIGVDLQGVIRGNTIVGNGENGVGTAGGGAGNGGVSVESGDGNRISGNIIYGNYGLPIDLNNDGPTANDAGDADSGPNLRQNFPLLLGIHHGGGKRLLAGSLFVSTSTRVEVYGNAQCSSNGRAEASAVVSTYAPPLAAPASPSTVAFSQAIGAGPTLNGIDQACHLAATATDAAGNTSELSTCFVDDTIFAHDFDTAVGFACAK